MHSTGTGVLLAPWLPTRGVQTEPCNQSEVKSKVGQGTPQEAGQNARSATQAKRVGWQDSASDHCCLYQCVCAFLHSCSVKDHAIRLAAAFEAPVVLLHSRGHVVPPLQHTHLAALRAFLQSIQQQGPPEQYLQRQQQMRQAAKSGGGLEPLDPPLPMWETEAEQVQKLQQGKQQHKQQQQEVAGAGRPQGQQQQESYVQVVKLNSEIGRIPQLASKL